MRTYTLPQTTARYLWTDYIGVLIISIILLGTLILIINPSFRNFIIAAFLGFIIATVPYLVGIILSKKRGEFKRNIIEIHNDCIIVRYFNGHTKKLCTKDIYEYMELKRYARTLIGWSKIGIKYLPKELVEKYNSTFGMHAWLPIGVGTKEQYDILKKEIEEFKKRNNITGWKRGER